MQHGTSVSLATLCHLKSARMLAMIGSLECEGPGFQCFPSAKVHVDRGLFFSTWHCSPAFDAPSARAKHLRHSYSLSESQVHRTHSLAARDCPKWQCGVDSCIALHGDGRYLQAALFGSTWFQVRVWPLSFYYVHGLVVSQPFQPFKINKE